MTIYDTEEQNLLFAYQEAASFLALDRHAKVESEWLRRIRTDRKARSFFKTGFQSTTWFAVAVATAIAEAYINCIEKRDYPIAPTGSTVGKICEKARALVEDLDRAGPWLIPEAKQLTFRQPLHKLAENPSVVPPRTAGRPPLLRRRHFVLSLAESLYFLVSSFPTRLIMVATLLGWEETGERQIREILSDREKERISTAVEVRRLATGKSEIAAIAAINQARIRPDVATQTDNRNDFEKVAHALELLQTLTDRTASNSMISALGMLANEFGLEASSTTDPKL